MIVWLASYPRSGNTYLRIILNNVFGLKTYSIYHDLLDIANDELTSSIVGHKALENISLDQMRERNELFFIKTHNIWEQDFKNDSIIYIIRDGRESLVSYKKYLDRYTKNNYSYMEIINGFAPFGSWGSHVDSWMSSDNKNSLVITFENLIDNPHVYVDKIAKFINIPFISDTIPSFNDLHNINPDFFRSGKKRSFKEILNEEEQQYFWLLNGNQMLKNGYSDDLPNLLQIKDNSYLLFKHIDLTAQRNSIEIKKSIEKEHAKLTKTLSKKDYDLLKMQLELNNFKEQIGSYRNSWSYKMGYCLLEPFRWIKRLSSFLSKKHLTDLKNSCPR